MKLFPGWAEVCPGTENPAKNAFQPRFGNALGGEVTSAREAADARAAVAMLICRPKGLKLPIGAKLAQRVFQCEARGDSNDFLASRKSIRVCQRQTRTRPADGSFPACLWQSEAPFAGGCPRQSIDS